MCVPSGAHLVSSKASLPYPVAVSRDKGFRTRNNQECSVTNMVHSARSPSAALHTAKLHLSQWQSQQSRYLKKYKLSSSRKNLIGGTVITSQTEPQTGSQVSPTLPAASITAPIEGSKTSKPGTFRALGRDSYKLYSFQLYCQVMKNNTKLARPAQTLTHTCHNCKNVIYANEDVTGLIHIAVSTISCSLLYWVQRQTGNEHDATYR